MTNRLIVLLLVLPFISAAAASDDEAARGEALIEQASSRMNIFELPSFQMSANVRLANSGRPLDGTFSLTWNGPDQWRTEITFPGYHEIDVGHDGKIYQWRNTTAMPDQISALYSTLGFSNFTNQVLRDNEQIRKVRHDNIAGVKLDCIEIQDPKKNHREVCIDEISGLQNRRKGGFIDADFAPIASKLFPRAMSFQRDGERLVDIHITELETAGSFTLELFRPPTNAVVREGCINPVIGQKTKDVNPEYPDIEKVAHHQGTVAVYALVDKAGVPHDLEVVSHATPLLDLAGVNAIRQWRFTPATCGGKPVEIETVVHVRYWLQPY